MRAPPFAPLGLALALASSLAGGAAGAAAPDKDQDTGSVHINSVRNPEAHAYRAILAGLDAFDAQRALAPQVPQLLFQARSRAGKPLAETLLHGSSGGEALAAVLAGDDGYALRLPLDAAGRFHVPRSQPALDADAELRLSKKRSDVRVWPYVRSPGLAGNQRRLGDVRLECQVFVAIAKKEAPLHIVLLGNAVMLGSDWCAFMKDDDNAWDVAMPVPLASAVLREGERSKSLRIKGSRFEVPVGDKSWGNDAIVEVVYAAADGAATTTATTPSVKASAP